MINLSQEKFDDILDKYEELCELEEEILGQREIFTDSNNPLLNELYRKINDSKKYMQYSQKITDKINFLEKKINLYKENSNYLE